MVNLNAKVYGLATDTLFGTKVIFQYGPELPINRKAINEPDPIRPNATSKRFFCHSLLHRLLIIDIGNYLKPKKVDSVA